MKLGFIVPGFSADEQDWCIPAHTELVRALAVSNEVHVVALRYPHRVDAYSIGGATVHSLNGQAVRGIASARLWQHVLRVLARENERGRFDAFTSILGSEASFVTTLAGRWLRVPSVAWWVNGEVVALNDIGYGGELVRSMRWMNRFTLRFADRIHCGCDSLRDTARARAPAKRRARISTVPLAVNTTRFFSLPPRESAAPRFFNVGSLLPVKAQKLLLEAFAQVLKPLPSAHLTIAGTGPLEQALRDLAAKLQIGDAVEFVGYIAHDELPALYHRADVFVQASRHEGQGMALLEAAACGGAVCGTNVGVLRDLAQREAAGVCETQDVRALAATMLRAYHERATRGARAHRIVEREYNLDSVRARVMEVYASLARSNLPRHVIEKIHP